MAEDALIAGIELGGTKVECMLASGPDTIRDQMRIPTTTPGETLAAVEATLDGWRDRWGDFAAIGIASFGPVSIDRGAADYGHITSTPKRGWAGTDLVGRLGGRYGKPVGFHTDVVGAALGEARWGAGRGLADLAYVTVGTGVGVGLIAGGRPLDGLTHAELGHVRPVRLPGDDWIGACPFHGACIEGLIAGPAIRARTGIAAEDLPVDHPAWDGVAFTLGQLLHLLVLTGVPRRIVVGGGVASGEALLPRARGAMIASLAGYLPLAELSVPETYVVSPALGGRAGMLGAVVLGQQALTAAGD